MQSFGRRVVKVEANKKPALLAILEKSYSPPLKDTILNNTKPASRSYPRFYPRVTKFELKTKNRIANYAATN